MNALRVRIPRSATTRTASGYAKLISFIEPVAYTAFEIHGKLIPTGTWVTEDELWPTPAYPKPALLLEHAGNPRPARGHNRHSQGDCWHLWRYRPGGGEWEELAQCCLPGDAWVPHMGPIIRAALAEARGAQPPIDLAEVEGRIARYLDSEIRRLHPRDARRVLTAVHDQLANRICASAWKAA